MGLRSRVYAGLDLRQTEGRPVLLLVALSFSQGLAMVMAETAANALFLSVLGAAALPGVYLAAAVVIPLVGASVGWLGQRISAERLALGTFLSLTILLLLFWAGTSLGSWVYVLLLLWCRIFSAVSGVVFWSLTGRLLDLRQTKRLYGAIGSGENIARVIGLALVPLLVARVGVTNLLGLASAGLIGAIAATIALRRMAATAPPPAMIRAAAAAPRPAAGVRAVLADRHSVWILALIGVSTWAFSALDLVFAGQVQIHFRDPAALANFLAGIGLLISIVRLLGRPLLTGPLIARYGVVIALLIGPVLLGLGALLLLAVALGGGPASIFWMVVLLRLSDSAINTVVSRPALQILFQPLPAAQRLTAQSVGDGVIAPLALGSVGLMGLLLHQAPMATVAPILLVVAIVWALVARLVGRSYLSALGQRLSRRVGLGHGADLTDPAALTMVRQALHSPHPGDVLYAIELLSQQLPSALEPARQTLLGHADPAVRRTTLGLIGAGRIPATSDDLVAALAIEPDSATRAATIRALCAVAESDAIDTVARYIDDPDPEIRRGVLVGLLHHCGIAGILTGGQRLLQLASSPLPGDRILAATILGELGVFEFFQPLRALFADDDPAVRRAVLLAAGQIKSARLVGYQIVALADHSTAAAASVSLERTGTIALPALTAAFAVAVPPVQLLIATVLGKIGGDSAVAALRPAADHPDAALRGAVYAGLVACGYRAAGAERTRLRAQIRAEAMHAAWLLAASTELASSAGDVLTDAIAVDIQRCSNRILNLIACTADPQAVATARANLDQGIDDRRAYAIEIIDVLLPPDLKPAVLPLFDDLTVAQRLQRLRALFPQPALAPAARLAQIIDDPHYPVGSWTRACAIHRAFATATATARSIDSTGTTIITVERVIALRSVPLFAATPSEVLASIADRLRSIDLAPETPIFGQGDVGDALFIVVAGAVRIFTDGRTLNRMGEGDVFGEMAVLSAVPRVASATTIGATTLLRLDRADLDALIDERPELTRSLIRTLARNLRSNVAELASLRAGRVDGPRSADVVDVLVAAV